VPNLRVSDQLTVGVRTLLVVPATWIEFPAFRRYEATRQVANNALMAMLAGSQLAAHTLQLTRGSRQLLPDIFPGVPEIQYFRLRSDDASELLSDVGHHLGSVAVPYVLAVHEDFAMTTLRLLNDLGYPTQAPGRNKNLSKNRVTAWNMHEAIFASLGAPHPDGEAADQLAIFHLLREMRNCQIHAGGTVSEALRSHVASMSLSASERWEQWAHRSPEDVVAGERVHFTKFDIFAVLANAKVLGRAVNRKLASSLPSPRWADVAVADYAGTSSKAPRSDAWGRGLVGHVQLLYGAAGLSDQEVLAAAVRAGLWSEGRDLVPRRKARGARKTRNPGSRPEE
jgi:hypothetical protein